MIICVFVSAHTYCQTQKTVNTWKNFSNVDCVMTRHNYTVSSGHDSKLKNYKLITVTV